MMQAKYYYDATTNPLAVIFAAYTIFPSLDFYYDGAKTWWEKNSWWVMLVVGVVATVVACIAAPFTCGASVGAAAAIGATLAKIAITTAIGAAVSLAIGGVVAGVQSALTGHGFWQAFGDSVCENFVDALVTSFAMSAITVAVGNVIQTRHCFKEGTLVETEDGLKPIEDIQVGDMVLAYDEETGEQAYKPVKQLFRNTTKEWHHILVNGEEIVCTAGHPFYDATLDKFVCARDLKVGNKLLLSDGSCGIIEAIQVEQLEQPETTYNFEVVDFHTYYVSKSKILVHNVCKSQLKEDTSISRDIEGEGKYGSYEITYESGNKYIGKGGQERMWQSAAEKANRYKDKVKSVKWRPSELATNKSAFIQEAQWMKDAGWLGKGTKGFYNEINSPGLKFIK